jgi:hypothetical protein
MNISHPERRDMILLLALVVLGVVLMLIVGQFALRLMPHWDVASDMDSMIDPHAALPQGGNPALLAPLRPEILTPPAWQETFLTPQANLGPLNEVPVVVVIPATGQPPQPPTFTPQPTEEQESSATPTQFSTPTAFPTNTLVFVFPTWTFTPKPPPPKPSPQPLHQRLHLLLHHPYFYADAYKHFYANIYPFTHPDGNIDANQHLYQPVTFTPITPDCAIRGKLAHNRMVRFMLYQRVVI